MSGTAYPPGSPTTMTAVLPSYLYQQYANDDSLQALVYAQNQLTLGYLVWFNANILPIYPNLSGVLLDWVANGLYGIYRPTLPFGYITTLGPVGSFMVGQLPVAGYQSTGSVNIFVTTDDVFKRIITWFFFKGDGQQFCTEWLKRRVMRFLTGINGTAPNIDNTYPISIAYNGGGSVTITVTLTNSAGINLSIAQIFQAAVQSGAVSMPFQLSDTVVIVNDLGPTGLTNNGGLLQVTTATGWPTSISGLPAGAMWDDGGFAAVVPGITPSPFAQPVYYGLITSGALLVLGGGNMPLADPHVVGQIWNNGGILAISAG